MAHPDSHGSPARSGDAAPAGATGPGRGSSGKDAPARRTSANTTPSNGRPAKGTAAKRTAAKGTRPPTKGTGTPPTGARPSPRTDRVRPTAQQPTKGATGTSPSAKPKPTKQRPAKTMPSKPPSPKAGAATRPPTGTTRTDQRPATGTSTTGRRATGKRATGNQPAGKPTAKPATRTPAAGTRVKAGGAPRTASQPSASRPPASRSPGGNGRAKTDPPPRAARPARRRATRPLIGDEGIFRIALAVACVPIAASVGWAIATKEWFAGDRSIMGVLTHDVFSRHPPLLGTVSTMGIYAGAPADQPVHHLGPAQFWALSIPDLLFRGHPDGLLVGALLINGGALVLAAAFVRRRLGALAATGFLAVCTILAYGLGPSLLRDIWTPFLGLWPVLALVVLTWSLIDGDRWALPWAALVSGFLAQIELMFVAPAFILVSAGLVGFALRRQADQRAHDQAVEGATDPTVAAALHPAPPAIRRTLLGCTAIAALMWWPVVLQQATGHPGNLTLLFRALRHPSQKAGLRFVWENLVAQLQVPPVFIRRAELPFDVGWRPGLPTVATAFAFGAALVAVTVAAWHRRQERPTVWALLVTAYLVLLAAIVNLTITPKGGILGLQYRRWLWPFGAYLWFGVIVGAASWARDQRWAVPARAKLTPFALGTTFLVVAVLAVLPATSGQRTPRSDDVRVNPWIQSMWGPLRTSLPEKPTFLLMIGPDASYGVGPEIMRRLVVDGYTMRIPRSAAGSFGSHRVLTRDRPAAQTLELVTGDETIAPPDSPLKLLAAGTVDGSSADAYVQEANDTLRQVRNLPGFALDAQGLREHREALGIDAGAQAALLADPTRAIFDAKLLQLQLAGHTLRSPISDEEAKQLREGMAKVGVLAFLRQAPTPPRS